jgi:hypothetical protein
MSKCGQTLLQCRIFPFFRSPGHNRIVELVSLSPAHHFPAGQLTILLFTVHSGFELLLKGPRLIALRDNPTPSHYPP